MRDKAFLIWVILIPAACGSLFMYLVLSALSNTGDHKEKCTGTQIYDERLDACVFGNRPWSTP